MNLPASSGGVSGPFGSALSSIHDSNDPYVAVRSLARATLAEANMIRPPFSAFLIADALGVAVRYEEMEDEGYCTTRGQLVQASFQRGKRQVIAQGDKNAPVIVLRRIRTLDTAVHSRQQFTLAHELGHLVLRSLVSRHYPEYEFETDDREEEAFCNAFAGELLIPTEIGRAHV